MDGLASYEMAIKWKVPAVVLSRVIGKLNWQKSINPISFRKYKGQYINIYGKRDQAKIKQGVIKYFEGKRKEGVK